MAVVIVTTLPSEANRSMDEAVSKELDVRGNPPSGMIIHTASEANGLVTIVDVWDSEQAFKKFETERLLPAIQKVTGMDASQMPAMDRRMYETYRVERGAR